MAFGQADKREARRKLCGYARGFRLRLIISLFDRHMITVNWTVGKITENMGFYFCSFAFPIQLSVKYQPLPLNNSWSEITPGTFNPLAGELRWLIREKHIRAGA